MKRLLQCIMIVALFATLFTFVGVSSAHAATRSTMHSSACHSPIPKDGYIYDLGTRAYLGFVELDVDGCGYAAAVISASQSNYHINHLWIRDSDGNNLTPDYGGPYGYASSNGFIYVGYLGTDACVYVAGVIQSGSLWGNGSTPCINPYS